MTEHDPSNFVAPNEIPEEHRRYISNPYRLYTRVTNYKSQQASDSNRGFIRDADLYDVSVDCELCSRVIVGSLETMSKMKSASNPG